MAKPDMMICIGPADLIHKNSQQAMKHIREAMSVLDRIYDQCEKDVAARDATLDAINEIDVARELLKPIVDAIVGRGPPPVMKPPRRTAAQRRTAEGLAWAFMDMTERDATDDTVRETLQ